MLGYEYVHSALHEIRHFHDALLSWPLFEAFIRKAKLALCMIQLIGNLNLRNVRLPITLQEAKARVAPDKSSLIDYLQAVEASYVQRLGDLFKCEKVNGVDLRITHLLEANAMLASFLPA